jgi:hypothetical protein
LYRYTYDAYGLRQLGWIPGLTYPGAAGSFVRMDDRGEYRFYAVPPGEDYLGFSGGGQPLGASQTFYYPGVSDEMRAIPLKVAGTQDIRIDTITCPRSSHLTRCVSTSRMQPALLSQQDGCILPLGCLSPLRLDLQRNRSSPEWHPAVMTSS